MAKYSAAGELQARWGSRGGGEGAFFGSPGPYDVAVDAAGAADRRVYVADPSNGRVVVLRASDGAFVALLGGPAGAGGAPLVSPIAVAVAPSGRTVYVLDEGQPAVVIYERAR